MYVVTYMSSAKNLKIKIEKLERKAKSTKRIDKRSILKAKIAIYGKVEAAVHGSIERIHRPGLRHKESLARIYSMVDRPSYVLRLKPPKYYLTRFVGGIISLLLRFKSFLANRLFVPPALHFTSYPTSMVELKFWYKKAFMRWKSSLGNYKAKVETSTQRNKNAIKRFFD